MKVWNKVAENKYISEGKIGKNCISVNASEISLIRNYNGSGPSSFGGADDCPVIKMEISFENGEEEKAKEIMNKIMSFLQQL